MIYIKNDLDRDDSFELLREMHKNYERQNTRNMNTTVRDD